LIADDVYADGMVILDWVLPDELKLRMNRIMEAKKVAEFNLIARRDETAAICSQANTAKLLADNPTVMRLRNLDKVAANSKLNVVCGKRLTERIVNVL
jgi:hypothetical protein